MLAERLARAAGMRNLLVHDYVRADRAIPIGASRDALVALRGFAGLAGQWLEAG